MPDQGDIVDYDAFESLSIEQKVEMYFKRTCALHDFAEKHVLQVVLTQLQKNDYEQAIAGTYYRMCLFLQTIVKLKEPCHFQTAAVTARSLFELLLDLKAMAKDRTLVDKFYAFTDVSRFCHATKLKRFLCQHPQIDSSPHQAAIQFASDPTACQRNEQLCVQHWGHIKKGRRAGQPNWPIHWSGKSMADRARDAGPVYEVIYWNDYGIQSYYVHAGGAGISNISCEVLTGYSTISHDLICRLFSEGTLIIADEFHLSTIDTDFRDKLERSPVVATFGAITQAIQSKAKESRSQNTNSQA